MSLVDEQTPSHEQLSALSDLLTVAEVGRILRWDTTTVRRHIISGVIPAWAVVSLPHQGKRTSRRIKRLWLESVLDSNKTTASTAEGSTSSVSF